MLVLILAPAQTLFCSRNKATNPSLVLGTHERSVTTLIDI
jgi:hypothetical protein